MKHLLSRAARAGVALTLFLLVLAVLRWAPVHAEPPWDVRALPLLGPAVVLAVLAGLTGVERRSGPVRPLLVALASAAAVLAAVVAVRGPSGLAAEASEEQGGRWRLAPGPVDVLGDELAPPPSARRAQRWVLAWDGPLRVPATGAYRLWIDGRGAAEISLDGRDVLRADGDPVRAGSDLLLGRGAHVLRVRLERTGPGPRLRLGWIRPSRGGRAGTWSETIPPRYLGAETPAVLWLLTDALAVVLAGLVAALALAVPWEVPRRPPAPQPVSRGEMAASALAHAGLALVMSWPLVLDLAGSGVVDRPDGRLNTWILAWDAHAVWHEPSRLFQAPIFHPLPDALTFTENLLLPAILAAPATLLGTPVLGYNLVFLGSCVVSGLGAQLLVRRVSGGRLAAFVGGAAFAVGAHRWFRMAHLHAEVTLFLPLALLALDRFWARRTLGRGLIVGLLVALQGLSSIYLGAITATAVAVATGVALLGGLRWREAAGLGAGAVLAALLLLPVARPYLRMRAFQGQEFTLADQANYATTLDSYAASPSRLYGPISARHMDPYRTRDALFPGLVLLGLGLAGFGGAPPRYRAVAVAASATAIVISLGPETAVYRLLHENVVLFRGIRALSRFSLIPVLGLCVLAGLALAGRFWSALVALTLLLAEASQVPLRYAPWEPPSEVARWLAGRTGAVVDLPLGPERDTQVMLDGLAHLRPLVNGDSGFVPRPHDRAMELLEGELSADALRYLRAVGVAHVVSRDERDLPLAARFGETRIYRLPDGPAARPVEAGRAVPVVWTGDGPRLDLGAEEVVGRIAFTLSDLPWVERPRVRVSADGRRWTALWGWASLADATLGLTRDPRGGLGEVRFGPVRVRYVALESRVPARPGVMWVGP